MQEQQVASNRSYQVKSPFWWVGYVPFVAALIVSAWVMVAIGGSILIPLLLGFSITFMLEPFAARLQRSGRSRHSALLLTLLATVVLIAGVLVFLLPSIFHQLRESVEKLPLAVQAAASRLMSLLGMAQQRLISEMFGRLQNSITEFEQHPSALTDRFGKWLSSGLLGLVTFGSTAVGLLIVPFFIYYLLLDMID